MKKIQLIYDNSVIPNDIILDVIGEKKLGDIIVKRKKIKDDYIDNIKSLIDLAGFIVIDNTFEVYNYLNLIDYNQKNYIYLHVFSNFVIANPDNAKLTLKKIAFVNQSYAIYSDNQVFGYVFNSKNDYLNYLESKDNKNELNNFFSTIKNDVIEINGVKDISLVNNFIQYITGGFEARYFNKLEGDNYVLTKKSSDIKKIKSEYNFYNLLPSDMKMWFVMPFSYGEENGVAHYNMERLHMTDLAIKWIHGGLKTDEFSDIMDKFFYFFKSRHKKIISENEYTDSLNEIYLEKVKSRLEIFKNTDHYEKINSLIRIGTKYDCIDDVFNKYYSMLKESSLNHKFSYISVIGHGDSCFSNTMYNKSTQTFKFIDPKGANTFEELWMDPYYDIAKLSHSVCGLYDYINYLQFNIIFSNSLTYDMNIDFNNDKFRNIFKEKLLENGYDYYLTRLYEVSLFLSMLPLHSDYPNKVFAYILNAIKIMEEIQYE